MVLHAGNHRYERPSQCEHQTDAVHRMMVKGWNHRRLPGPSVFRCFRSERYSPHRATRYRIGFTLICGMTSRRCFAHISPSFRGVVLCNSAWRLSTVISSWSLI